jgi:hypothetical protein
VPLDVPGSANESIDRSHECKYLRDILADVALYILWQLGEDTLKFNYFRVSFFFVFNDGCLWMPLLNTEGAHIPVVQHEAAFLGATIVRICGVFFCACSARDFAMGTDRVQIFFLTFFFASF